MSTRTDEDEAKAFLRQLRRLGITNLDASGQPGALRLRAKVQVGRAHRVIETGPHTNQADALDALLAEARDALPKRSRPPAEARPLARIDRKEPPVGEVESGEEDTRTMDKRLAEAEAFQADKRAQRQAAVLQRKEQQRAQAAAAKAARPQHVPPPVPPGPRGGR